LGGGTGKPIAIHFFDDELIQWDYVDFCPAMAKAFTRNLANTPLGQHAHVMVEDLTRAVEHLQAASYDVILLSLVLSSMPALPSFAPIARLLAPGGALIITDISPGYTHLKPLYKVKASSVALRTALVDPLELIGRAKAAGLESTEQSLIQGENTCYSFVAVFSSSIVRPSDRADYRMGARIPLSRHTSSRHPRRRASDFAQPAEMEEYFGVT
jgi:SAM-dependent methyltransferase